MELMAVYPMDTEMAEAGCAILWLLSLLGRVPGPQGWGVAWAQVVMRPLAPCRLHKGAPVGGGGGAVPAKPWLCQDRVLLASLAKVSGVL